MSAAFLLLLLVRLRPLRPRPPPPTPPPPPRPQPPASDGSVPAGSQLQVQDGSVPRRTSTARSGWQCSPLDLNREFCLTVFPEPRLTLNASSL